ncbi:MAG: TonB family protein [Phycisphaerae bacterium]
MAVTMSLLIHAGLAIGLVLLAMARADRAAEARWQEGDSAQIQPVTVRPPSPESSGQGPQPVPEAQPDPQMDDVPELTAFSTSRPSAAYVTNSPPLPSVLAYDPQPIEPAELFRPDQQRPPDLPDVLAMSSTLPSTAAEFAPPWVSVAGIHRRAEPENRVHPVYPQPAIRRGLEGLVVIEADISAEGVVSAVRVVESSGHDLLDHAAADAVGSATFRPAIRGGLPAAASVRIPIRFQLR